MTSCAYSGSCCPLVRMRLIFAGVLGAVALQLAAAHLRAGAGPAAKKLRSEVRSVARAAASAGLASKESL